MDNITDLLSTLMSGGSQPQEQSAPGVMDSGVKALNSQIGTGNILARLRGGQTGQSPLGSALGAAGGGMAGVKTDGSKFGAFAQGLAGGMKSVADQRAAQAKSTLEAMKAQWDHEDKLANRKQQADTLAQTKLRDENLNTYYKGLVENGKKGKDGDEVNDIYKTELARGQAASRFGIKDPMLNKTATDPMGSPEDRAAAQAELARRQGLFDAWDAKQPWSKGGKKSTAVPSGAAGDDAEDGDGADNPNPTPDIPTPPARPPGLGGASDSIAGAQPSAPDPTASPGSWRTIRNPKSGEQMLWNDTTGETKPLDGTPDNPAAPPPSASLQPPQGFSGDNLPAFGG